jgi:RND family efflux transporter MFP subunit
VVLATLVTLTVIRVSQKYNAARAPANTGVVPQSVVAEIVTRSAVRERIDVGGVIAPSSEVVVTSKVPGRVTRVLASVGKTVRAGDPLFEIDSAEFASLRAALAQAEINLRDAETSFRRLDGLYKQQAISRQQWESALNRLNLAKAQYQAASESLAQAGGAAGGPNGERMVLSAPQAGTVASRTVDAGNLIAPGTPLMTIVDIRTVLAKVGVPERAVNKVAVGSVVDVTVESVRVTRKGRVESVGPAPDPRTKAYPVDIVIDNPSEDLKPGMFARIGLTLGVNENAVVIPRQAVVERLGNQVVYVVRPGDPAVVEERVVILGLVEGDLAEVLGGVTEGEQVVVLGQHLLSNGAPVMVVPGTSGEPGRGGGTR